MVRNNSAKPGPKPIRSRAKTGLRKISKKNKKNEVKSLSREDIISKVVELHNEGKTQSVIGLILKQKYGIKSIKKVTGKTVLQILKEKNLAPDIPEDLRYLLKKAVALIKHMQKNKKDMTAKRGYQLTVSKIRRLARYYKKKGILPKNWTYSEEKAALLVR